VVVTWRVPVVLVVLVGALAAAGYAVFPRDAARTCCIVALPLKQPANDAPGAAGWVWPGGVPGWKPGETVGDVNVSGVQPIELEPARVDAARAGLDADSVRVVQSMRPDRHGTLAILAAPLADYAKPAPTCLGAMLQGDTPVRWFCPSLHELAPAHVLVAAARVRSTPSLTIAGVARGDVDKVVLTGVSPGDSVLYQRSATWGQFGIGIDALPSARLLVYGHGKLLETVRLALQPGQQRDFR
jgi:hypothetical protein